MQQTTNMIVSIYKDENEVYARTEGCGCCSIDITDKKEMIQELKQNIKVILETCEVLGLDFDAVLKEYRENDNQKQ